MLKSTRLACIFAGLSVLMLPIGAFALCVAAKDMSGVWKGNDRATYYVSQVGNDVWWVGMSVDNGAS